MAIVKITKPEMTERRDLDPARATLQFRGDKYADELVWRIEDAGGKHVETRPDPLIDTAIRDHMRDKTVAYFSAAWSSICGWAIGHPVENQEW